MEVLVKGTSFDTTLANCSSDCSGWCSYNPDSNCWDEGD